MMIMLLYGPKFLSMDPFPHLNKAFSLATQEERHQSIVRARDTKTEAMSFAVQASSPSLSSHDSGGTRPKCTFCGRLGHTYERCYQRIGFPPSTRGRGRGRGNSGRGGAAPSAGRNSHHPVGGSVQLQAAANAAQAPRSSNSSSPMSQPTSTPGLNTDQMTKLLQLLDSTSTTEPVMGKLNNTTVSWLLDSGASHHMTGTRSILYDCHDLPLSPVNLPDGVQTTAILQGSVSLSSGMFYMFRILNAI